MIERIRKTGEREKAKREQEEIGKELSLPSGGEYISEGDES